MKGYILNKDKEHVNRIIEGIQFRDGHCPCRVTVDETTLCPCDDFINNHNCLCNLFVKQEDADK